jgi:hypothetical protein
MLGGIIYALADRGIGTESREGGNGWKPDCRLGERGKRAVAGNDVGLISFSPRDMSQRLFLGAIIGQKTGIQIQGGGGGIIELSSGHSRHFPEEQ